MNKKETYTLQRLIPAYLALAIGLFTLNPILLNKLQYSPEWIWKFSVTDFAQNILLFLPFGLAFRHCYRHSQGNNHVKVLLYGLLLSSCIESSQLFIEWRSSNVLDIISNGLGALMGSYFHRYAFSRSQPFSMKVPLACMYVPLGWVSTIRSLWEIAALGTVFLSVIASLSLIQAEFIQSAAQPSKLSFRTPKIQPQRSWMAIFWMAILWLGLFLAPLFNTRPVAGIALIAIAPLIIILTAKLPTATLKKTVIATTIAGLILVLGINSVWYFTHGITSWSNNEHLRVSELLLSTLTLFVSIAWYRSRD